MKVRIQIDTQTFLRFWLVVFGLGLLLFGIFLARTALIIVGTSAFLALALNRPVVKLASWLPGRSRVGGTALAFTVVVTFLAMVVFLVVPPIIQQTARFVDTAPSMVHNLSQQWHGLDGVIDKYNLQPQIDDAVESFQRSTSEMATSFTRNIVSGIGSVFSLFAATLLVLVLTFLMLVEGPQWIQRMWRLYTDHEKMIYHRKIAGRMYNVVTGYVTGQLTVSGIGAMCAGAVVFLLSLFLPIPGNLAFPTIAIAFTLSLIPMFGATIAGVIITVLLGMNDFTAAIIFVVYFMIYQQIENNFISPTIQSKRIELSPLAVLVAVTIGLYVFGVAGGIISIPIAGCLKVLAEEYLVRSHVKREQRDKPMAKLVRKIKAAEKSIGEA